MTMTMTMYPKAAPCYLGVDLGGTKIFGALVSADGVLAEETYVEHGDPAASAQWADLSTEERAGGRAYDRLLALVQDLLVRAQAAGRTVAGVGVGAPGITRDDGVVVAGAALGWREFPLAALLERRLGLPVRVENDVNLAGLGELAFGAGRGARSLFLMAIGTGIGGAVILDGKLWRGRHFAAGEIGSLLPGREFLAWTDRKWGAFEAVASGTGIAAEARKAMAAAGIGVAGGEAGLQADRVFAAAAEGAPWALAVAEQTVELWTLAIAAVQVVLDPEVVVLSGGVSASAEHFVPEIESRLRRTMLVVPRIVRSSLGYRAAVLGAPGLLAG
jgi:glucokinase